MLPPDRGPCKETTFALITAIPNTYQVSIHNSCFCNELIALTNRHLVDRSYINFNSKVWLKALKHSSHLLTSLECALTSIWKIANSYTGGKRKQYLHACEKIFSEGISRKDFVLKMFVKPDKYKLSEIESKPPRAIQYRSPKYNLALARYLKDLEHQFYQIKTGRTMTNDIAKGRNLIERASDLLDKANSFNNPIFLNVDYSKMDSCVNLTHQRSIFRQIYLKLFPSKELKQLLFAQLNNKGYSKNGIKYRVKGTRCSGDFTTGFENSLINWIILRYILHLSRVNAEIYIDGDDSVIIMEKEDKPKFLLNQSLFEQCGFEAKLNWADSIETVDFCQSRLLLGDPPRMARNPLRALSNFNISLKNYPAKVWPRLLLAKANSERYGGPGIPILAPIGDIIASCLTGVKPLYDKDQEAIIKLASGVNLSIDDTVRVAYDASWNITPYEQELIEQDPHLKFKLEPEYYIDVAKRYQALATTSESLN